MAAVNFENYEIVINQSEIKTLTLELFNSNLPLNEGNIATLEDTLITYGSRGSKYKDIRALVGPKVTNPFIVQADGLYGVGRDSLFSIDSNNPEDLAQNMPNKPYYPDGNRDFRGKFSEYSIVVNSIKKK